MTLPSVESKGRWREREKMRPRRSGKAQDAIEILKVNVHAYPESWNAYDSLGEAYAVAGQKDLAIQNYQKSLELNAKNDNARQALAKLKTP